METKVGAVTWIVDNTKKTAARNERNGDIDPTDTQPGLSCHCGRKSRFVSRRPATPSTGRVISQRRPAFPRASVEEKSHGDGEKAEHTRKQQVGVSLLATTCSCAREETEILADNDDGDDDDKRPRHDATRPGRIGNPSWTQSPPTIRNPSSARLNLPPRRAVKV